SVSVSLVILCCNFVLFMFFFFFQAEDGIRDWSVTGVQTCALPILALRSLGIVPLGVRERELPAVLFRGIEELRVRDRRAARLERSEERRVGKEGRSRWWRYH